MKQGRYAESVGAPTPLQLATALEPSLQLFLTFVEILDASDTDLNVSGNDSGILVVHGGIIGKFKNFSSQVFEDGGCFYRCRSSNTFSISALLHESGESSDWELKSIL